MNIHDYDTEIEALFTSNTNVVPIRSAKNPNIVVDDLRLYPEIKELKDKVKILDVYENLEFLLSRFKATVRYNMMTRKREIAIPSINFSTDNRDNDSLSFIENIATLNGMPIKQIDKWMDFIANQNPYHPVVDCLAIGWDGIPRLDDFIKTLVTTNPEQDYLIIKTWMILAVATAHSENGFTQHGLLVLQGAQGIGKTEWVKKLDPTNCGAVKVGVLLDPTNKDSVINASRFWIDELGELDATLNKTDIAHLKSYITSPVDHVRVPWGRKESYFARRTSYIATVNEKDFLIDTSGNRRFWTTSVIEIDYMHKFDMAQVWAEAKNLWKSGALTYLDKETQQKVNDSNKSHERIDPLKEKLLTYYDWSCPSRKELTATAILAEMGHEKPTLNEALRMGRILATHNGKPARKSNGVMIHEVPYAIQFKNSNVF